jgi:hypothetical protein
MFLNKSIGRELLKSAHVSPNWRNVFLGKRIRRELVECAHLYSHKAGEKFLIKSVKRELFEGAHKTGEMLLRKNVERKLVEGAHFYPHKTG